MSYLAYMSKRSFVFEDYVWSHTPFPYTIYDFALRPARIPLNAFISGPTAGGPMPGPRAVNAEFWEVVCPKDKRRVISSKDAPNWEEGSVLVNWWVEKLKGVDDPCLEVDSSSQSIFDVLYVLLHFPAFSTPHHIPQPIRRTSNIVIVDWLIVFTNTSRLHMVTASSIYCLAQLCYPSARVRSITLRHFLQIHTLGTCRGPSPAWRL
jgi:hypothetical protein